MNEFFENNLLTILAKSRIIVRHIKPPHRRITIPNHKVIAKGTLRKIIKESGLSLEEFKKLSK